jgi:hypothetical protein
VRLTDTSSKSSKTIVVVVVPWFLTATAPLSPARSVSSLNVMDAGMATSGHPPPPTMAREPCLVGMAKLVVVKERVFHASKLKDGISNFLTCEFSNTSSGTNRAFGIAEWL